MSDSSEQAKSLSAWRIAFDAALARQHIGNLTLLADEAPTPTIQAEARELTARLIRARLAQHPAPAQLTKLLQSLHVVETRATRGTAQPTVSPAQVVQADITPATPVPPIYTRALLFSGHMIDKADRAAPRFPADKEPIAKAAIEQALDAAQAGPSDLAICGGACGGDILFAEACLTRGLSLQLLLAFEVETFLGKSVAFAGAQWVTRFHQVASDARTTLRIMPRELGPSPVAVNVFERCNRWQLATAVATARLHVIALWDSQGGDGAGGTAHMIESAKAYGGDTSILATTRLWPSPASGT